MKEEKHVKRPPRGPMAPNQKAKNFKNAMLRLFKELSSYKVLITISMILAIAGAVLSIMAPNRLSDLTDEISKGLVVNTNNMETLTKKITKGLQGDRVREILDINLDEKTSFEIMASSVITPLEKEEFTNFLNKLPNLKQEEILSNLTTLPNSVLSVILKDSEYEKKIEELL